MALPFTGTHAALDQSLSKVSSGFPRSYQKIRVRLALRQHIVKIRGDGLRAYWPVSEKELKLVYRGANKDIWTIKCWGQGISVKSLRHDFEAVGELVIRSRSKMIHYNGIPYRAEIRIYPTGKGCEVVNHLRLHDYLASLINSEFSTQWSFEGVKAQVIAARSYALYKISEARKHRKKTHFDLESTVADQVYEGSLKEDSKGVRGVRQTQGMVLSLKGKLAVPVKAFYHSTCGGQTELPQRVWGNMQAGFSERVPCPYCKESPRYDWVYRIKSFKLTQTVLSGLKKTGAPDHWPKNWSELLANRHLVRIRPYRKKGSKRNFELVTYWKKHFLMKGPRIVKLRLPSAPFRNWLEPTNFRSTRFKVATESYDAKKSWRAIFVFRGKGNGHGVGMCQYGAKSMGEKGFKMAQILKHYYPGTEIRKVW